MVATPITTFTGRYRFLSNFSPAAVFYDGEVYPTVEHAFQAAKTLVVAERQAIRVAATPGEAKRLGRRATLRPGWNDMRLDVMRTLIRRKFDIPANRTLLLSTGDAELIEGNTWNDT